MSGEVRQRHWDAVYGAREETALTWYEDTPHLSLELALPLVKPGDALIDVGGGRSRFIQELLARGFGPCTVLDISSAALEAQRAALGSISDAVIFVAADITEWQPDRKYQLWHDRAVFHFLTDEAGRLAYLRTMAQALPLDAHAIIATFDEDGPEQCSGLPVVRYSPAAFASEVDRLVPGKFAAVEARRHIHLTPKGNQQRFQTTVLRRNAR